MNRLNNIAKPFIVGVGLLGLVACTNVEPIPPSETNQTQVCEPTIEEKIVEKEIYVDKPIIIERPVFQEREIPVGIYMVPFFGGAESFVISEGNYDRIIGKLMKDMYRNSPDGKTLTAKSGKEIYDIFDKIDVDGVRDAHGRREISTEEVDVYLGIK